MILNMAGGVTNAIYKRFSLDADIDYPNDLVIDNIDVSGGIVHGFALYYLGTQNGTDNFNYYPNTELQTIAGYADEEHIKAGRYYYTEVMPNSGPINTSLTANGLTKVSYNKTAKTLTLGMPFTNGLFKAGYYDLLVW